jgi:type II secretory pathway component HofQ
VELKEGDVLVIGGVEQDETINRVTKVPVLGDIPLLKTFFRHTTKQKVTRDLLVVVSPEIIGEVGQSMPTLPTDKPEGAK